jgi:hypothetical protein
MTIKPNRTSTYQFTVDMSSESDMKSLKEFRKKFYGTNQYVKIQGRWGKDNPDYTCKKGWHGGNIHFCPVGLAQHCDVYVYWR